MKWSEQAWLFAKPVYDKILELPFIIELTRGTLAREKFIFYIRQDTLYLGEYGKVLTGIAYRLEDPGHRKAFVKFAGDSISVEQALHASFIHTQLGEKINASPSCLLYTSYLHKQLANAPVEVVLAAVLPCFRIYKEVGDHILKHQTKGNNPYQSWIDTYGGEEFERSVTMAITVCDEIASQHTDARQQEMMEAYLVCSRFEWMFWESAYRQEEWLI